VEPVRGSCDYKVRMSKHSEHPALSCCDVGRSLNDYFGRQLLPSNKFSQLCFPCLRLTMQTRILIIQTVNQ